MNGRGRRRAESGRSGEVSHERLALDFLAQVQLHVGAQRFLRLGGGQHQRQRADPKRALQVELGAELLWGEREHLPPQCASPKQVDTGGAELACAGAEQREAQPALLNEAVDLVEQPGQALYLIDDHPASGCQRAQLGGERRGIREQPLIQRLVEQIETPRVGQLRADPRALANATQAEQEEARLRQAVQAGNELQ